METRGPGQAMTEDRQSREGDLETDRIVRNTKDITI